MALVALLCLTGGLGMVGYGQLRGAWEEDPAASWATSRGAVLIAIAAACFYAQGGGHLGISAMTVLMLAATIVVRHSEPELASTGMELVYAERPSRRSQEDSFGNWRKDVAERLSKAPARTRVDTLAEDMLTEEVPALAE
jgi:hypothetical protein